MGEELHCGLIGLVAGGQHESGHILPTRLRAIRSEIMSSLKDIRLSVSAAVIIVGLGSA